MKRSLLIVIALILLVAIVFPFSACTSSPIVATPSSPQSGTPTVSNLGETQPATGQVLADLSQIVAQIRPSVVAIDIEAITYDFFNQPQTVQGAGSGWIIDADGYIMTNNHVVEGAETITVTLNDGRVFPAEMVRTDSLTDLAVVKISASNLTAAPIGDATKLEIADWAVAIGNSLGMGISATVGVISALDVSLQESPGQTLHGLVQTDAAINPGNSGGPLVNSAGEVIGINSIKISQVGVEGMGYAIATNEAMPIIQKLIEVGYIVRPWLGINAITMNEVIAARYNFAVSKGVLLTNIVSGGPADQAALEVGDIITAINDKEIDSMSDLVDTLNSYNIGETIDITYWRGETKAVISLVLAESPKPQ